MSDLDKKMQISSEYIRIKNRLKQEIARRDGFGSMASYGTASWDYSNNPNLNSPIMGEYIKKLINPILYIKDINDPKTRMTNSPVPDLGEIEEIIANLETEDRYSESSSCRGACTGLCSKSCTGACYSCHGNCSGSCSTQCVSTCGSNCINGCGVHCQGNCSKACGNQCAGNCITTCAQDCNTNCYTNCNGCAGTCSGTCAGSCTKVCIANCGIQSYN